jgi:hypothetical protein
MAKKFNVACWSNPLKADVVFCCFFKLSSPDQRQLCKKISTMFPADGVNILCSAFD